MSSFICSLFLSLCNTRTSHKPPHTNAAYIVISNETEVTYIRLGYVSRNRVFVVRCVWVWDVGLRCTALMGVTSVHNDETNYISSHNGYNKIFCLFCGMCCGKHFLGISFWIFNFDLTVCVCVCCVVCLSPPCLHNSLSNVLSNMRPQNLLWRNHVKWLAKMSEQNQMGRFDANIICIFHSKTHSIRCSSCTTMGSRFRDIQYVWICTTNIWSVEMMDIDIVSQMFIYVNNAYVPA